MEEVMEQKIKVGDDDEIFAKEEHRGSQESEDNESDLDMDIAELARRPCPAPTSAARTATSEIDLQITMLEDVEEDDGNEVPSTSSTDSSSARYGLRKRRAAISYKGMSRHSDDEDLEGTGRDGSTSPTKKKSKPKDLLDLTVLLKKNEFSQKQLKKFVKNSHLTEELSRWTIGREALSVTQSDLQDEEHFALVQKFVEKCAKYLDHFVVACDYQADCRQLILWPKLLALLSIVFKNAKLLKQLSIKYHKVNRTDTRVQEVLRVLQNSGRTSLNSLKIVGDGDGLITKEELDIIITLGEEQFKWTKLVLGDALWEDVDGEKIQKLLEVTHDTLESFVIHGGIKGTENSPDNKSRFTIKFPRKMPKLQELTICPKYSFVSDSFDNKNPSGKRWREIRLDSNDHVEEEEGKPLKITLSLDHTDFPKLEKIVLGNLVELEEYGFALLRNLKVFRCGSRWDLAIRFPKTQNKKGPSVLKDLQLPDGLKDPLFVQNVAKFFPFLIKVWIFLPSVRVLRTFFKSYENSMDLEELHLKTQFDFETLMETCLLPQLTGSGRDIRLSAVSKSVIRTLKEYTHFVDYVRYHNIELPLEEEELDELRGNNSAGIRALKSLQVLDLEHIPRKLPIPNPEDERRWYDHNFKYLTTTLGFNNYPFSTECHNEIVKMNLKEYRWKNLDIASKAAMSFIREGYIPMAAGESWSSDEDDLFTPIYGGQNDDSPAHQHRLSKGIRVAVKPSMLIPNHFNKNKREN